MSGKSVRTGTTYDEAPVGAQAVESADTFVERSVVQPSVGQQLRAAREARGFSATEAARAIKLSLRQVEALEADDWSSLPCKTIIRGFVRNYARLLHLDPDPLMAALDGLQMPQSPELKMTVGTPVSMPQEGGVDRRDYARVLFGLIVLALAIAAYFFVPPALWHSALSAVKEAVISRSVPAEVAVSPPAVEAAASHEASSATETAVTPGNAEAAAPPIPTPISERGSAPISAPLLSTSNVLKFSFAQPSWVEVRDRNGQVIFSQLSQAGSEREIQGEPPFSLVIGNSAHVTLLYRNKSVDLSKRSKDDVARLTLE